MHILNAYELTKSYGDKTILNNVTLGIDAGQRIGVLGANGSGKTTLFRILAGVDSADGGQVTMRNGLRVAYLPQEPKLDPNATVRDEINRFVGPIRDVLERFDHVSQILSRTTAANELSRLLHESDVLQQQIERLGGWEYRYRVDAVMTHLRIDFQDQTIGTLSGGQLRRVALAQALVDKADLLILDEPTNHLDAETVDWLEQELAERDTALLLITHDRYFLDRVVTRIVELDQGNLFSYDGGYTEYLETRTARLEQEARADDRRVRLLKQELEWLSRRPKARGTKAKSRVDAAMKLKAVPPPVKPKSVGFDLSGGEDLGKTILHLDGITFGYANNPPLLRNVHLRLVKGDRLGIVGPNGTGKTTLLRLLTGEIEPDRGTITVGKNTKIAYFDQKRSLLNDQATVQETLCIPGDDHVLLRGKRVHVRKYLDDFLFSYRSAIQRVGSLSGGERNRLLLMRLMLVDANLILLDEPTNDLDIMTLQVLEDALANFPGCLLVVTHDRYFLDKVATGIVAFEGNGEICRYEGDWDIYKRLRAAKEAEKQARTASTTPSKEPKRAPLPKKGLTFAESLELEALWPQIEAAEQRVNFIEQLLENPQEHSGNMRHVADDYVSATTHLTKLMTRWEELESKK
ncbi:MAG: ABC-F family ATP-binding cassette domain-containing protein [Myxococcales bacterium]|nr:ABC-F family ATP-binding cassette domain-containing protein [Myxococcales bacterium]